MATFGFFVAISSLTLQGIQPQNIVAFGAGELIDLSNQYRANQGLPTLVTNPTLMSSAQAKANHMVQNQYFAHDAPDGTSPWVFFSQSGYNYLSAGENLALSNQSAATVVKGWFDSPGHRANMMSSTFIEVGYGIAFSDAFTYNNTNYSNVYLVAAHYAQPHHSSSSATSEDQDNTTQQLSAQNVLNMSPRPDPQNNDAVADEPTESEQITPLDFEIESENTYRSGESITTERATPKLSNSSALIGLGGGGSLILLGSTIEIRRLLQHKPLLPGLKR